MILRIVGRHVRAPRSRQSAVILRPMSSPPSAHIEREHQTLLLPTGHQVAWAEYGPSDGLPLFAFHGFPSSRFEFGARAKVAEKKGIRLICPDRPGFGLSTLRSVPTAQNPQSQMELPRIVDYPNTVLALADHLSLPRFAVAGFSGGGPFAVACAASLPTDRLVSAGIVASGGPWIDSRQSPSVNTSISSDDTINAADLQRDVMWIPYLFSSAVYRAPAVTSWVLGLLVGGIKRLLQSQAVQRRAESWMLEQWKKANKGESDSEERERIGKAREMVTRTILEAFRQGADGAVHEARLLSSDWGIDFGGIKESVGLRIWHGTKDANAPINQIRYLAQRIPGAVLTEYDQNHFGVGAHIEEILEELTGPLREQQSKDTIRMIAGS